MVSFDELRHAAAEDPIRAYALSGYAGELRRSGKGWTGLCPFHSEKTPSFTVFADGGWRCFGACAVGGDVIDFFCQVHHVETGEAGRELGRLFGLEDGPTVQRQVVKPEAQEEADPDPVPESFVSDCHKALLDKRESLAKLTERKALPTWIVDEAKIGLALTHWRDARYTIPVPALDGGTWHDCRGYAPGRTPKMLPYGTGRRAILYPWAWVRADRELVWCEGEVDALNLNARGIAAVSATNGTCGAVSSRLLLPDLTGYTIRILADADAAGEEMACKLPDRLREAGAIKVTRLRWPHDVPKGYDVSDFFAAGGDLGGFGL